LIKKKIKAARADKAAQDFEAVYISEMLKTNA
jgi:Rod binding domain-containing protein